MIIRQFDIWLANLEPRFGTEPVKTRPVLVVQTNYLNDVHPSVLVCPLTSNTKSEAIVLRVHIKAGHAGLTTPSDIMIDQLRAIDNRRLIKRVGQLPEELSNKVKENLRIVLDLE